MTIKQDIYTLISNPDNYKKDIAPKPGKHRTKRVMLANVYAHLGILFPKFPIDDRIAASMLHGKLVTDLEPWQIEEVTAEKRNLKSLLDDHHDMVPVFQADGSMYASADANDYAEIAVGPSAKRVDSALRKAKKRLEKQLLHPDPVTTPEACEAIRHANSVLKGLLPEQSVSNERDYRAAE